MCKLYWLQFVPKVVWWFTYTILVIVSSWPVENYMASHIDNKMLQLACAMELHFSCPSVIETVTTQGTDLKLLSIGHSFWVNTSQAVYSLTQSVQHFADQSLQVLCYSWINISGNLPYRLEQTVVFCLVSSCHLGLSRLFLVLMCCWYVGIWK